MAELPEQLVIGEILRPHGLRGEVRMRVLSQQPQHLKNLRYVYLADGENAVRERVEVGGLRFNKAYALLKLAGVSNRNQAEELRGKLVICDIAQLPPLDDGEYFLFQVVGMRVVADDAEVGNVREALETGANDVYIVDSDEHGELLIPAHDETIDNIDFARGVIEMTLPEGLLPPTMAQLEAERRKREDEAREKERRLEAEARRQAVDETETAILALLSFSPPQHMDKLISETKLPAGTVSAKLMHLELRGIVRNAGTNQFCLKRSSSLTDT